VALSDHTVLVACGFQQSPPNGLLHQLVYINVLQGVCGVM